MTRISLFIAAALFATNASAQPAEVVVTNSSGMHVGYADLDIHSSAGRAVLTGRIHEAAASLCNDPNADPLDVHLKRLQCYRVAIAGGVSQMNELAER